jgi:hypothetical protein
MVLALALPTGYSMGLPQAISSTVMAFVGVLQFIVSALIYLAALLLSFFLNILGLQAKPTALQRSRPQLPSVRPSDPSAIISIPWFELLKSMLFWGILLAILSYSVYQFLREREGLLPRLEAGLLHRLIVWLRGLFQHSRHWSAKVRGAIARRLSRRPGPSLTFGPWRVIRLAQLSPGQRVRYFFLSVLRRAARVGYGRGLQQTPYEYSATLAERIPETGADVVRLTQAFVEARYSQRPMDEQEVSVIQQIWKRTRAALARKRSILRT